MSEQKGRKRHVVTGEVADIKKSEEGLGLEQVAQGASIFTNILKSLFSKNKDKNGK